jgi:hypothetical protein
MALAARVPAGTNEGRFRDWMQRLPDVQLRGKRRFTSDGVAISVDESLEHEGRNYLIEIDSGNMAKLLVGQYVLLNQLHPLSDKPPFFLVVHTYKDYKPRRTIKNLCLVNQQLYGGNGIEFGAVHFDRLERCNGTFPNLLELLERP